MKRRVQTLAGYIEQSGETQEALAARLGVTQPTISRVQNGGGCSFALAKKLSKATGVPIESFGPRDEVA